MDTNLKHEDLLIKLRSKLNEEKLKLWEMPYISSDSSISQSLQELAQKYASELLQDYETVLQALCELQVHSIDRSKANAEFRETGFATFRIKATVPGDKPSVLKVQNKLDAMASEVIAAVAIELGVDDTRIKLIHNGKVIKATPSLEEQGLRNGAQIMALVMAASPDDVKKEDKMYMEMKSTRDDAALLSEQVDDLAEDEEYMKLEDQSGKTVDLPPAEKRSLLIGLALHERGRAAARAKNYPLALVLLLEGDRQLSECSSSILKSVDNWAVLQLDVAWCYLCLQSLAAATDAAVRLSRAEEAFRNTYGENHERLIALKGTAANERALLMRMYLLQGIVAFHQNKRAEARRLLDKAEVELNALRVNESSVSVLVELGWSPGQARTGLRATGGDLDRAHHYLEDRRQTRESAREESKAVRRARLLGTCADGTAVDARRVRTLCGRGYTRTLAAAALRNANNDLAEADRILREQPDLLADSDLSSDETDSPSSDDTLVEPEDGLVTELSAMGYDIEEAKTALRLTKNQLSKAVNLLIDGGGKVADHASNHPSTSAGSAKKSAEKRKTRKRDNKRREKEMALNRLQSALSADHDGEEHLETSLVDEEQFLTQYKSLL